MDANFRLDLLFQDAPFALPSLREGVPVDDFFLNGFIAGKKANGQQHCLSQLDCQLTTAGARKNLHTELYTLRIYMGKHVRREKQMRNGRYGRTYICADLGRPKPNPLQ